MDIPEIPWPYLRTLENVLPGGSYRSVIIEQSNDPEFEDGEIVEQEFVEIGSLAKFSGVPEREVLSHCRLAGIEAIPSPEGDGILFIEIEKFRKHVLVWSLCRGLEIARKKRR